MTIDFPNVNTAAGDARAASTVTCVYRFFRYVRENIPQLQLACWRKSRVHLNFISYIPDGHWPSEPPARALDGPGYALRITGISIT
jgi:hypothetical protein